MLSFGNFGNGTYMGRESSDILFRKDFKLDLHHLESKYVMVTSVLPRPCSKACARDVIDEIVNDCSFNGLV